MTRSNAVTPDYYEILNIQSTEATVKLSKQQLKLAYHKALLKHHPDKASSVANSADLPQSNQDLSRDGKTYTIDEITTAYKTLSDPQLRAEYDRALRLNRAKIVEREKTGAVFHTGLEVVDLEDLACEEEADSAFWYRGCRCGDEKGFLVLEEDLEREADHGEIVIGCRGCSLWMKVLFAVEDG